MDGRMMAAAWVAAALGLAAGGQEETPRGGPSVDLRHGDLKVSENRRFLVHADGTPFFYLGDTAWELFHRLTREEAEKYLENRRQKGFTVIQAVALAELDGLNDPNPYGHRPLLGNDPARPDVREGPANDYWDHVDFIVDRAREKGIYIGMLPTWGDKVTKAWGVGPVVFTPENAAVYGRFIGARYKDRPNILWILGGDRPPDKSLDLWREMAKAIREVDKGRHLMTYHPSGGSSTSKWFHNDEWLDFNLLQSGHNYNVPNYNMITADYNRTPVKPCIDGEPRYEDHPAGFKTQNGYMNDYDSRQAAYWALFAGAHGHTYGCHDIWQMFAPGRKPISWARTNWYDALDLPGAWDMWHVRTLMESRPVIKRVPDPSLIDGDAGSGADHVRATRGEDYAFVYIPTGKPVTVQMGKVSGTKVKAWWFDPRRGVSFPAGDWANEGTQVCTPPSNGRGNDWVLVMDDVSKKYPPPGKPGNAYPAVSLAEPASGAVFKAPATIPIRAAASDLDGKVVKIELYQGTTKLGEGSGGSTRHDWKDVPAGLYTFWAKATDDKGAESVSAKVTVTVGPLPTGFYRAVNLNGPPLTIDGNAWEGGDLANCSCRGQGFENQGLSLDPPTDPDRARMIRSSVWDSNGSGVTLKGVPEGTYQVYLYVWEDNESVTFDITLNGSVVQGGVKSGSAGQWKKLGPWTTPVTHGRIEVTCSPADANLSGIEVWRAGAPPK
jgi:hypothetical protein